jgi:hypothetical protein
MALGKQDESFEACGRALALDPRHSNAHSNMAICLVNRGRVDEALAGFRKAIQIDPNNACAHDGLGLTLLMTGDLQEGWREQEWRWRKYDFPPNRYPNAKHWHGEDLKDKTILIYIEQGFGDVIHFSRYIPLLAERGARVLLEDVPELSGLLKRSLSGLAGTYSANEPPPPHDFVCSLMSMPMWYGTSVETIPAKEKYIFPDEQLVGQWSGFFKTDPNIKVGIAWAGRASHNNDMNRSATLAAFGPLGRVPGVTYYSLQKGPPAAQIANPPPGLALVDLAPRLDSFETTAAVISHLDMVIAVDTVVVHLAAAMGKTAWTLCAFCPDWRWLLGRSDTPWYPTMRLFRQPNRGDWAGVVNQAAQALYDYRKQRKKV